MSAEGTDVARIQDEDVLRRMWQDTSDFGRKKEIRTHMYKLREARLKEFYNSSEGNTVIERSTMATSASDNSTKPDVSTTHADNLADQSYVTLKSKEVRDSESPTRDSYNKTIAKHQDQGWTITSSNEQSQDGKTHTSTHVASTSGTQPIDGGKVDYSAKLEDKASVFQEGDDKNFSKSVEASSSSAIRQEASGGDENSNFKSSTIKTSSSSKYASETKSSNEYTQPLQSSTTVTREQGPYSSINEDNVKSITERTYTSKVPSDLKNHPSYVEGKTKVTQETKTLADGTIVTTTQYETKQGNSTQTATHKKYSNVASTHQAEQRSSSSTTHLQSSRNVTKDSRDSRQSTRDDQRAIEYIVEPGTAVDINVTDVTDNRQYHDSRDINRNESVSSHQSSKIVRESTHNEQVDRQSNVDVRANRRVVKGSMDYVDITPVDDNFTTTRTTVTKTTVPEEVKRDQKFTQDKVAYVDIIPVELDKNVTTRTTTTKTIVSEQPRRASDVTYHTNATSTQWVDQKRDIRDSKNVASDQFVTTEQRHEVDTRQFAIKPEQPNDASRESYKPKSTSEPSETSPTYSGPERQPNKPQELYSQPDRRQPIRPGKSELDQRPEPTEGQYDTTYRSEFTNKKISVEVSPTHDAFARSLRAVTPERITRGSPRDGSNTSLRSSTSPEKMSHPSRISPDRYDRSKSPRKSTDRFSSTETITYRTNKPSAMRKTPDRSTIVNGDANVNKTSKTHHYSTDTITKRSRSTKDETVTGTVDSSTLTRKKNRPRSPSPTGTTTSDFEYVDNSRDTTTDLDIDYTSITTTRKDTLRPSSLEITSKKVNKVTDRSPSSPLTELASPRKSPTKEFPRKDKSPTKDVLKDRPKLARTDTYEERVKQILGIIGETKETRRNSLEKRRSSLERNSLKRSSLRETTTKTTSSDNNIRKVTKTASVKDGSRKSPEKQQVVSYPERKSPTKTGQGLTEFSYQTRKSPEKQSSRPLDKKSPVPNDSKYPAQMRKSPEKQYIPERKSPNKSGPSVSEFPSQIRKSPERQPLEPYPEKKSPTKTGPHVSEFPSQIRRSPERQPLDSYPEKKSPTKTNPSISEFPSQVRRSPDREPLEVYPEKKSPIRTGPNVSEFPSQIRRSPERQPLEPYPEKKSPTKTNPSVSEFPSQIRRSPERQPLESYPEKKSPTKTNPSISEFPSQIRRSPDREPLEVYPEKKSPIKTGPNVSEFPSHIRRSPERQPLEPYPEKKSPTKIGLSVSEFPSQIRRSPEREPLEPYPERKSPTKTAPNVSEFPSQIRRSPERQPLEPYPEKKSPTKIDSSVSEFPSQIRRSPERELLEPYPERKSPTKIVPSVSEFPSQIRRSPERQSLEPYPENKSPTKIGPSVSEFPSQIRRSPEKEPLEPYPEKNSSTKTGPSVSEFPSQIRKSPEREPSESFTEKKTPFKTTKKEPGKKFKKPRNFSESSTSTEEEDHQIEEIITETTKATLESRIPVSEPIAEKKIFSQLCQEDKVTRLDKKKTTEELLAAEISQSQATEQRTVRKDKPLTNGTLPKEPSKKPSTKKTITTSEIRSDTTKDSSRTSSVRKYVPREKTPIKRPSERTVMKKTTEISTTTNKVTKKDTPKTTVYVSRTPTPKKQPETIYRVEKTKFIGETEYQDEFSKANKNKKEPIRKSLKPTHKVSLSDIENFENIKEDSSVHIRTNRVDDTVTKKKVSKTIMVNGDITKTKPKISPIRQTSPVKKIPVSVTNKPVDKVTDTKPKSTLTSQSRYSNTIKKTLIQNDDKPRGTRPTEPKKHVVTATITVSPKIGPKTKPSKLTSKTVTTTKTTTVKPKETPKNISNGYESSDTDDESIIESVEGSFIDLTEKRSQFSRTTSNQTYTKEPDFRSPDKDQSTRQHVITTKTVIITNDNAPDREVIVNLQRSKSSREPTPDRLCPRPLTSDEEEDYSPARYPDEISEPDEGSLRRKSKKLSDIPIFESEDGGDYSRISEVTDSRKIISKVDKVEETDESLLSIDKKINKFLNTADQLTKEPLKSKPSKVERPTLEVTDDLREDECLLSVSDKVNKFINTSEQIKSSKVTGRPVSPRPKTYDEGVNVSIHKKVTQFKTSVEEANKPTKVLQGPAPKVLRPDLSNVEDSLKEDECLLSVSDKVSKFISTAEKLTTPPSTKPVSLSKIDIKSTGDKPERSSPVRATSPKTDRRSPINDVASQFIKTERKEEIYNRISPSMSPERHRSPSPDFKTPTKRPSNQYSNILKTDTTIESAQKEDIYTSTSPFRCVKKAKALFENIRNEESAPKQKDILSRPSVLDDKQRYPIRSTVGNDTREEITARSSTQRTTEDQFKSTKLVETVSRRSQSPQKSPERPKSPDKVEITRFRASSPEKIPDIVTTTPRSREPSPDGDIPHYMKPLDRSLRPNSPHRDSINQTNPQRPQSPNQEDIRQTKFGVTLRRTDSGRVSKATETSTATTERRKSSITLEKRITEEEIEELFELEVLEELLEKITGYELRRKIRAQIRLVKKLITEGTLKEYIAKRRAAPRDPIRRGPSPSKTVKSEECNKNTEYQTSYTRKVSPERKVVDKKLFEHTDVIDRRSSLETSTEYQSSYSFNERRSSTERSKLTRQSPARDRTSPLRSSPERKVTRTVNVTPSGSVTTTKTTETIPGGLRTTTTKTTENKTLTTLKKTAPVSKKSVEDSQPEWVRQRNLRNTKASGLQATTKVSTATSFTKKSTTRSSPAKEIKPTDIITSSYGVGPTDENGTPLFGLRALRAQNKNEKIKVQGTVIRSQYYSENDQEPVGQVSLTKYSTDPRDLAQDGIVSTDGKISSVTTTQKFGYKETPSLRSLTDKRKEICDTTEKSSTKTTKLNRRGSVKEMSKKFIDNAVETLKSERQTTYPKAGLILRASSFKGTNRKSQSRESSPDNRGTESSTVTVRSMKTSTSGETFLSNKSQISGVQDVLTRMKNEDEHVDGDTEEDIAARGLLNKFLGAQVILTGMESRASSASSKTTESTSPTGTVRRSTKVTSTITEGGRPTTTTRGFQRPVAEREIETIWDEQTLRLLLEQSTDYEERRILRVRLRQLMAEQEACTDLVDEATKSEGSTTPTTPTIPGQLEGESQLLPLLQGLLAAPENDITPDSGTESGEDQRSSLIAEVQCALDKLSNSLRSDQTDITPERRTSLLQLVTKLQAGLSGSSAGERRSSAVSSGGRFQKRKNKQARHTVGVSKEELADARKLIEEISLNELTPSGSTTKVHLSKQNSESSVPTSSASSSYRNINQAKVKNTTPKPFSSSNSTTSSVQTPTEHFDGFDVLFNEDKEVTSHEAAPVQQKATPTYATTVKQTHPNLERNTSVDSSASIKSAYKAVQQAAALKREQSREDKEEEEEEEDESSIVKGASDLENASLKSNPIYSKPSNQITKNEEKSSRFDTQKKLRMKRANTIDIPKPIKFYEDEDDSDSDHDDGAQKRRDSYYALRGPINVSNPNTKKIVPSFEPKTESDKKFLAFINNHNEQSANQASVWNNNSSVWGNRFGNIKNNFEKQATNDAKSFWKSTDDNITRTSTNQFGPKISRRSARNLQQMFEEKQKETLSTIPEPRQSFANTGHTKANINTSQQQSNVVTGSLQVKTKPEKNYRVVPQPLPVNQFSHAPQSAFKPIQKAPQSLPKRTSVVFSPDAGEIVKSEIKSTNGSAFLYSPKPLSSSVESSTVTSPIASKPWAANVGGSRVLSMAASKFQQPPPQEPPKPRKLSKDVVPRVFIPTNQVNSNVVNRSPVYLGKAADTNSSTVRKLSGQYENVENNTGEYHQPQPKPQSYQIRTSVVESQYTPPVKHYEPNVRAPIQSAPMSPPQNYSIRYDQPQNIYNQQQPPLTQSQNYTIRYDNPHTQVPPAQNYSIRYDQPQIQQPMNQNQYYQQPPYHNYNNNYDHQARIQSQPQQTLQQPTPQNYSMRYDQQPQYQSHSPQNYSIRYDRPVTPVQQPQSPQYKPPNYSVRYDQPVTPVKQPQSPQYKPPNYSVRYDEPPTRAVTSPNKIYQRVPSKEAGQMPQKASPNTPDQEKEYTSTIEFKPTQSKVPVQAIEPVVQAPKIQRQTSEESVHEHIAVSSRVMSGPVSQQAVTVRQKSPMNRDQHDMEAAFSLKNSLQKVSKQEPNLETNDNKPANVKSPARSPSNSFSYKPREREAVSPSLSQSFKSKTGLPTFDPIKYKPSDCPKPTVAPSSFKFKSTFEDTHKEPKSCGVVKPMQQQKATAIRNNVSNVVRPREKLNINDQGQSVLTGQFHIPLINVKSPESPRPPPHAQVLSKSDSWHEICLAHQNTTQKPAPSPGPVKSKSSHSLALPKLFEAGMSKDEMLQKRRTMEAFLTGSKSPQNDGVKNVKRSINRVKTSQKVSTQKRISMGGGLTRSRTLPDIICPDMLDESNVDQAFDELFQTS